MTRSEYNRMRYLKRLVRLERVAGRHPTKKANWLKFCHRCGADISGRAKGVVHCERCELLLARAKTATQPSAEGATNQRGNDNEETARK